MIQTVFVKPLICLILVLGLAACQSSEERAEEHYQNALRLIEAGDTERGMVELRNVFQNNGLHREARTVFADLLRAQGNETRAYRNYLILVEQYPDDLPARIALAELAIESQLWDEARRHGEIAIEAAPQDPAVEVITVALAYAQTLEDEDAPARRDVVDTARQMVQETPDTLILRRVLVDGAIRDGDADLALQEIADTLAIAPEDRQLYDARLALLVQLNRVEELEEQLLEMMTLFPGDEELTNTLLRFYFARGDLPAAETFLRQLAAEAETDEARIDALSAVVQLRQQTEGVQSALDTLDEMLAELETPLPELEALRAGLQFESGDQTAGITALEAVIAGLPEDEANTARSGQFRVALARMFIATGNDVRARALIEEVLASDAGQVDALTLKANWLIDEDNTSEAINLLRLALDEEAENILSLTLMARAHARNGDRDLAREFLALAASAPNAGPDEALRYAEWLIEDERFFPAEETLIDALRARPGHLQLLAQLGQLYLQMEDWPRAEQVERTLEAQAGEDFEAAATRLRIARLSAQDRVNDAVALLEAVAAESGDTAFETQLLVIQSRLAQGNQAEALAYAQQLVERSPDSLVWRFALATTQSAVGQFEEAAVTYRSLLEEIPQNERAWVGLIRVTNWAGDLEGAQQILEEALEAVPDGITLLWVQASFLENVGEIDSAVEIYERLYERAPNVLVVANNLASLLSTYYEDEERLDRAYVIARRFRGADVAPFQDTYGWIAYRRGEYDDALEHLEPAAEELRDNALVQYHLGMTYRALGRNQEAQDQLARALELAGPEDTRSQFELARATIAEIEAEAADADAAPSDE